MIAAVWAFPLVLLFNLGNLRDFHAIHAHIGTIYTHPHSRSPTEWRRQRRDEMMRAHDDITFTIFFKALERAQFLQFTLTYFGTNHHILEFKIHGEKEQYAMTFPLIILLILHSLVWCFAHHTHYRSLAVRGRLEYDSTGWLLLPAPNVPFLCGSQLAALCSLLYGKDLTFCCTPCTSKDRLWH